MGDRKVVQDWITVRCGPTPVGVSGDVIQSVDKFLRVGPGDTEVRVELVHISPAEGPTLVVETSPSEEEAQWSVLGGSSMTGVEKLTIGLVGEAAGLVRWRLQRRNPGDCATFRITVPPKGTGIVRTCGLRDPRSPTFQPWVTLKLSASFTEIVQTEEHWFDAGDMPVVVLLVQASKLASCVLALETAAELEGPWSPAIVDLSGAVGGPGHTRIYTLVREGDATPWSATNQFRFKRYLRWRLTGGSASTVASFRMSITPAAGYAPLPGTGPGGRGACGGGCGCACGGANGAGGMLGGPLYDELRPLSPAGLAAARDFLAGRRVPTNPLPYAPPAVDKDALCEELRTRYEEGRVLLPTGEIAQTPASEEAETLARALGCPWPEFVPHRPFYRGSTDLPGPPYKGPGPQPCRTCPPRFRRT